MRLLAMLILLCCLIEGALFISDLNRTGANSLRQVAYAYGGFWPGLLADWEPRYPLQPYLMFLTHSFLHAGWLHLLVNMITLWSLGRAVIERVNIPGFAMLYGLSILGGALGYAILASGMQPMVGASGALFGLAGGLLAWSYVDRLTARLSLWPVVRAIGLLIALNLLLWWAMSGRLAWQAHLGGFVGGWIAALLIDPRPGDPKDALI